MNPGFGQGRGPCGGWPAEPRIRLKCKTQHKISAHTAIPKFVNTTKVPDYASPPGADIDPYTRPNFSGSVPACGSAGACGGVGEPGCGKWPEPVPENTFTEDGTIDLSVSRKRGWKGVQAMKWWHGRWGYNSSNWFAPDSLDVNPTAGAFAKGQILGKCRSEVVAPDATRYRTLEVDVSVVVTGDPLNGYGGARDNDASSTMTVDRNSGVRTGSATIPSYGEPDDTSLQFLLAKASENVKSVYDIFEDIINDHVLAGDIPGTLTLSSSGTEYKWTWVDAGNTVHEITVDPIAGHFRDEAWNYFSGTLAGHSYEDWQLSGASLVYVNFLDSILDLSPYTQTLTCNATLTDAYTGDDLADDRVELLAEWNLADDAEHPWRTDNNVSICPLVRRHEVQLAVEPVAITVDGSYTDPNAANYTGEILGAPLPAGYVGFFDFRHEVWRMCDSGSGEQWYVQGFGDSVPAYLPQNATGWTNWKQAADWARKGEFTIHFPGVSVQQKWAEIVVRRPSHNYFRPCGADRNLVDQTTARCILSTAGSPVVVTIGITEGAPEIETGDLCVAAGIGAAGVYEVTKLADDEFELTTLVRDLPPDYPDAGEIFGKVRFPEAWAVCGRIAVANASNESPILVTLAEAAPYLATGDSVTIAGVLGNTAANGTFIWTRLSDTTGTLDGTTGDGAYTSGGHLKSDGAPDWEWNDDRSKGDYVVLSWDFNQRDLGEYARLVSSGCLTPTTAPRTDQLANGLEQSVTAINCATHCLRPGICSPAVICISPNAETFPNGTTHAPAVIGADDIYGSRSQSLPLYSVDDPLWQVPRPPCSEYGETFIWRRDNGGCQIDAGGMFYYPVPRQVEARCGPPVDAPDLALGLFVGWLSQEDVDVPGPIAGNIAVPPVPLQHGTSGEPLTVPTPWSVAAAQEGCVCEEGRFAEDYEDAGVTCPA